MGRGLSKGNVSELAASKLERGSGRKTRDERKRAGGRGRSEKKQIAQGRNGRGEEGEGPKEEGKETRKTHHTPQTPPNYN